MKGSGCCMGGFTVSKFYCLNCHNEGICIPRNNGRNREPGHLKNMYCIHCKKNFNHVEIRSFHSDYTYDDFLLEVKYDNFTKEGIRKEPYRVFRGNLKQKGLI